MTLDEARASIEDGFKIGPIGNYWQAPTGEPYVEVLSGGAKTEGANCPCLCASPELAIKFWLEAMREYAPPADRKTLYWRVPPEMSEHAILPVNPDGSFTGGKEMRAMMTRKVYYVYSRVLVSDKPQIQPATLPRRVSVQDAGYLRVGAVSER